MSGGGALKLAVLVDYLVWTDQGKYRRRTAKRINDMTRKSWKMWKVQRIPFAVFFLSRHACRLADGRSSRSSGELS